MSELEEFLRKGFMFLLGDTLGFLHAVFSIIGLLMIFVSVLAWGIGMLTGAKIRNPIIMLLAGFIVCSIFGFTFGLNYFDIVL